MDSAETSGDWARRPAAVTKLLAPIPDWLLVGAKLGAILCGFLRTAMDVGGIESPLFRAVWTAVDARGHGLEMYGSEGWGLSYGDRVEFSRAC